MDGVMRPLLAVLGAALLALVLAPAAHALPGQGSCTLQPGSPPCLTWTGKVTWISDGDTVDVDVDGDGTRKPVTVRLIGIQAMEQSRYSAVASRRRGDCHAVAATDRLEKLLRRSHMRVRLAAQDPNAMSFGRPWRNVAVRVRGHWRDAGRILLREGLVLAMPNAIEYAWNHDYELISEQAAARRAGLFDDHSCGAGPSAGAQLSLRLTWSGHVPRYATENLNVDDESVEIDNPGASDVPLGGWWVRDSGLRRYTFPAGAVVPAGGSVTLFVGSGQDTPTRFFWGLPSSIFGDFSDDGRWLGDGAYLFDPQGDLRVESMYPCLVACS
jgi:endonuclease YncB( thermonuclease family)